jgi:hypothetical protein
VPPYYDSLGKLVVWAPTREGAIARGRAALNELSSTGVTNADPSRAAGVGAVPRRPVHDQPVDRVGGAAFLAGAVRS